MKKIAYLIWSLDLGGAEQVVVDLAKGLDRKQFEPIVICLNDKGRYAGEVEALGLRVLPLKKKAGLDLSLVPKLNRIIREEKVALIHTHLFSSNFWGRLAGLMTKVPVVATEHGIDRWRTPIHLAVDRLFISVNCKVIYVSRKVRDFYAKKICDLNGKAVVLYNGIDISKFDPSDGKRSLERASLKGDSKRIIGTVGRLVADKDHENFIDAIAILVKKRNNISGIIVGEGELRPRLEKKIKKLELEKNITITGYRRDVPDLYKTMDVFVLSSVTEGFPLTTLEAMAAGVPVVATDVGGIRECIEDGEDGLVVPSRDAAALAGAIEKILDNEKLCTQFIANGGKKVRERFSVQVMVKAHEDLYHEILGR